MAGADAPSFAALLQQYRLAGGLTQEELAEAAGLSLRGVSDLERGINRRARVTTVQRLVEALRLSPYDRRIFEAVGRGRPLPDEPSTPSSAPVHGGFLGALPIGPLVERVDEVARIISALDQEAGGLVLLSGEPGVGKTRLAQEIMLVLRERGYVICTGRCYEPERAVRYYPFLDMLAMAYGASPDRLRLAATDQWPLLTRLLPGAPAGDSQPGANDQHEQQCLIRSVTAFLVALAEHAPVALLFDDLQWADASSVALLQHLVRHVPAGRLCLLATSRSVDLTPGGVLESAVIDLDREDLLARVALEPFSPHGTSALLDSQLGGPVSDELAAMVHARTEGNPFFIWELAQALADHEAVSWREGAWQLEEKVDMTVPDTVAAVIGRRFAHLDPDAQLVLQEAAVLGHAFGFQDLLGLAGRAEEEIEDALEFGRAAGFVRVAGKHAYTFNHALTLQTLYDLIPPRRKRRLHLAAARALERSTGERPVAEVARHFLEADEVELALPYLLLAGERAEQLFDDAEAERYYQEASALARDAGDREHQAQALDRLGAVLVKVVRYDVAMEAHESAAIVHRELGDSAGELGALAVIADIRSKHDSNTEEIPCLREVVGLDGREPPLQLAALDAVISTVPVRHEGKHTECLMSTDLLPGCEGCRHPASTSPTPRSFGPA